MLTLIRKARRRLLYNDLLSQGATAVCAALAAFIVLLLLGTEILNWYWLLLIPAATLAVTLFRVRQRVPTPYVTAQIVDRRMDLADSLSTAVFFSDEGASKAPADFRRRQMEQAERAATGLDVRRAIPFTVPRSVYPMAALLLVAGSLFALRYGLTRRLDLGMPMARIVADALGLDNPKTASIPERKDIRAGELPQDATGDDQQQAQPQPEDPNQAGDLIDDNQDQKQQTKGPEKSTKDQDAKQGDSQNGDDQQGQGQERASDQQNQNRDGSGKENENQKAGGQDSNSNSSSLLSKMRDAVQNLLSSMKQQPSGSNGQQQQQNNSAQNSQQQKNQQKGGQQKNGEKQNGQAGGQEQDPDLNNESQQAENSPGQGQDTQPSNKQPGGGAGNRDGAKDIKQAEQLAAMGKISQIIGKRNQNLSGEATIETQSTVQQLKTAYSDRSAQHAEAGGEIGRDEIPAALENYVERYFEQVRKEPAKK